MTWSNTLFLSEMMGTLALMLGIASTLYYITRNKLDGQKKVWTFAFGAGVSVSLGVATAISIGELLGGGAKGFVNPAAALMFIVLGSEYEIIVPVLTGQILGALIGFIITTAFNLIVSNVNKDKDILCYVEETFKSPGTHRWINDAAAEVLGTFIFLLGIFAIVISSVNGAAVPILGFHLITMLVLVVFGDFPMLINPTVGIQVVLGSIVFSKGARTKEQLTWLGVHLAANLSTAAILGGILYLFN